jgi:hypothetical protein
MAPYGKLLLHDKCYIGDMFSIDSENENEPLLLRVVRLHRWRSHMKATRVNERFVGGVTTRGEPASSCKAFSQAIGISISILGGGRKPPEVSCWQLQIGYLAGAHAWKNAHEGSVLLTSQKKKIFK